MYQEEVVMHVTTTFSSIAIPNPVVIIYADGEYIELTSVSTTAFILTVPNTYPTMSSFGYSVYGKYYRRRYSSNYYCKLYSFKRIRIMARKTIIRKSRIRLWTVCF